MRTLHSTISFGCVSCVLFLSSCNPVPIIDTPRPATPAKSASGPTLMLDPLTIATLSGTVTLDGPPPVDRPIDMSADPSCQQMHSKSVNYSDVSTGPEGGLSDVVVYIRSGLGNYHFAPPPSSMLLDQKGCLYQSQVIALMAGQRLEIRNDDVTVHNIHSMARRNPPWNKSQPHGATIFETFSQPELAVPLVCNVHPWMRAFAFVFDNPYFAITSADGKFILANLPPGSYTIEAWHQRYGTLDQMVTLSARASVSISFVFRSNPSSR